MQQSEIKEAVQVIEEKLREGVDEYRGDLREIKSRLKEVEQRGAGGFHGMPHGGERKGGDLGRLLSGSNEIKGVIARERKTATLSVDYSVLVKNTLMGELPHSPQTADSTVVAPDRLSGIIPGAFRVLNILDFIMQDTTSSNLVQYTRESAFSSGAAETEEAATKPESDLNFELVEDKVATIPTWLRVSRQVFEDSPALQAYLDMRLRHAVRARLQRQILRGDGNLPNLAGISASGRHQAFSPETGESALDTLNRAKWKVVDNDYQPNFIMLNPNDVGAIERLKRGDSDDVYLVGDGGGADYVSTGLRGVIWELPIVASNDVQQGKFYLGDSMAMQLLWRQNPVVEVSDSDSDNFTRNLLTVRSECRAALAIYTPAALLYGDLVA